MTAVLEEKRVSQSIRLSDARAQMASDVSFVQLMQRVRAGDEHAALELHAAYAEEVQRFVRVRLTHPGLRRQLDSADICQSVFADFFVRACLGQFDLNSPAELMKLLATMARNRLFDHARKQKAARRDIGRVEGGPIENFAVAGVEATPSRIVSAKELLESAQKLLSEEEIALVERRRNGEPWEAIASSTGRSAEALRKQYKRALDRVSAQLGMGQFDE